MWIKRDISNILKKSKALVQILIGPRQCGKSSLLWHLGKNEFDEVTFDDLQLRTLAENDPALFLSQQKLPLIIDEVQYAPNIFPEIKRIIDKIKRERVINKTKKLKVIFRLTGSNQILLDKNVKETLVGRASYYSLNTLSVSEIQRTLPKTSISQIMFQGGWPELYTEEISPVKYLNDYIRNYVEKDIVLSAGISKQKEFHTVLGMLAARTGEFLNYSAIAKNSGVKSVTIKEWTSVLEKTNILYLLKPCQSNLNKRLSKSPKLYFLDTGLATRLQGWQEVKPMMLSPQAGHLFETLVLSEIIKFINNHDKSWDISVWKTKDGEEVDFIINKGNGNIIALDAKMGIHSVTPKKIPTNLKKSFPQIENLILVSISGKKQSLSKECLQVPIEHLSEFLQKS